MMHTTSAVNTEITVSALVPSFVRHLRAENKSERTVAAHLLGTSGLARFLAEAGMPQIAATPLEPGQVERDPGCVRCARFGSDHTGPHIARWPGSNSSASNLKAARTTSSFDDPLVLEFFREVAE
jgi:hypothetical protein